MSEREKGRVKRAFVRVDPDKEGLTPEQMDAFFEALGLPTPSEQEQGEQEDAVEDIQVSDNE